MSQNEFEAKCRILSAVWTDWFDAAQDQDGDANEIVVSIDLGFENEIELGGPVWKGFLANNFLGLPLAAAIDAGIVNSTHQAEAMINECFENFLSVLSETNPQLDDMEIGVAFAEAFGNEIW